MDLTSWTPGTPGKGAVFNDGTLMTWNYNGDMEDAIHSDVIYRAGLPWDQVLFTFYIEPDATVYSMEGEVDPFAHQVLTDAGFNVQAEIYDENADWTASVHIASNVLNWQEGEYGRGLIADDGTVHTFDAEEYYNHADYEKRKGLRGEVYFGIQPDGEVLHANLGELPLWAIDVIEDADSHLHVTNSSDMRWMG